MSKSEAANDGKLEETLKSYVLNEVQRVGVVVASKSVDAEQTAEVE